MIAPASPIPTPTRYRLETFVDPATGATILAHYALGADGAVPMFSTPLLRGQATCMMQSPQGQVPHQYLFDVPTGVGILEAFDRYNEFAEAGIMAEIARLKKQQLGNLKVG